MQNQNRARRWIRRPDVRDRYGISDSTITRWVKAGAFPAPKRFGLNTDRWDDVELSTYDTDPDGWKRLNQGAA